MRTVWMAALIGGGLVGLLGGLVGADFNAGLAPPGTKQQAAMEGAVLWAVAGLVIGTLLGAALGAIIKAVWRKNPKSPAGQRV